MAQFSPHFDGFPLEEQIKALGDEELLDFWEETQHLEGFLEEEMEFGPDYTLEYERLIIQELHIRTYKRLVVYSIRAL